MRGETTSVLRCKKSGDLEWGGERELGFERLDRMEAAYRP